MNEGGVKLDSIVHNGAYCEFLEMKEGSTCKQLYVPEPRRGMVRSNASKNYGT